MESDRTIAYFSMEIALEVGMPTYSGAQRLLFQYAAHAAAIHDEGVFSVNRATVGTLWQHGTDIREKS